MKREPEDLAILQALSRGPAPSSEIVGLLEPCNHRRVRWDMGRLYKLGVLDRVHVGPARLYSITELGRELLKRDLLASEKEEHAAQLGMRMMFLRDLREHGSEPAPRESDGPLLKWAEQLCSLGLIQRDSADMLTLLPAGQEALDAYDAESPDPDSWIVPERQRLRTW